MNKSESIKELAAALSKFQAAVAGAKKCSDNPYYKSKYADLATIWQTVRAPLTENGLSVSQVSQPTEPGLIAIETILMHESGEWISGVIQMLLTKSDPQGAGSAITYARRYGLAAILGVHQEDDDAQSHNKDTAKQKPKPEYVTSSAHESREAHALRLEISALVAEMKHLRIDGFHLKDRREASYKKHLDTANPNECSDTNLLSIYRDSLKERRDQFIADHAKTRADEARAADTKQEADNV